MYIVLGLYSPQMVGPVFFLHGSSPRPPLTNLDKVRFASVCALDWWRELGNPHEAVHSFGYQELDRASKGQTDSLLV